MTALARQDLELFISARVGDVLDACTRCGKCVEVCPVTDEASVPKEAGPEVVGGILSLLAQGQQPDDVSARWLAHCNGCGECISACPEHVNPRRMLMFAQVANASLGAGVPQVFRKIAQAVRISAAMQLPPEQFNRLFNHRFEGQPDVLFYTGCNALRTPHVLLNAMQILDALDVNYEVAGGPTHCCGIAQTRTEGEVKAGGKMLSSTTVRFADSGASKVLSWCPSCQLQMTETFDGFESQPFDLEHISGFLAGYAEELGRRMVSVKPRRVLLHAHTGLEELGQHVEGLLDAIPGLTRVATMAETGYTCGLAGSARSPVLYQNDRQALVDRVADGEVDAVVSLYHSCHRSLVGDAERLGVPVVNFTDLIVEALGQTPVPDEYTRLNNLDARALNEATHDYLQANGVEVDESWFETNLDDLRSMGEYRGGLACFGR
jgi:heterodisulfide reductase subunit D